MNSTPAINRDFNVFGEPDDPLEVEKLEGSIEDLFGFSPYLGRLAHLASFENEVKAIQKAMEDDYYKWQSFRIQRIMAKAKSYKVELLIFPELSVPAPCLPEIRQFTQNSGMVVFAGTHYVSAHNLEIYDSLGLSLSEDDIRKNIAPVLYPDGVVKHVEKKSPAQCEDQPQIHKGMAQGSGPGLVDIPGHSEKCEVSICIDYPNNSRDDADLYAVAAYTSSMEPFSNLAKNRLRPKEGSGKPTILANCSRWGGSGIYGLVDEKLYTSRYLTLTGTQPLLEGDECLLIAEIDLEKHLIIHHSLKGHHHPMRLIRYIPFHYDQENIPQPGGGLLSYAKFLSKVDRIHQPEKGRYVADCLSRLSWSSVRDSMAHILAQKIDELLESDNWQRWGDDEIKWSLEALCFDEEIPTLEELYSASMFGTAISLEQLSGQASLHEREWISELTYHYARRQKKMHEDGLIRPKLSVQIAEYVSVEEAVQAICRQTGSSKERIEREIEAMRKLGVENRAEAVSILEHKYKVKIRGSKRIEIVVDNDEK